jgi:glycyl-tRNA synthetase beta chain
MAAGDLEVAGYDNYLTSLRKAHVMADQEERKKAAIREVTEAAASVDGRIMPDDELVDTVTNLVEEPHAVCGSFDKKFLALPDEVLITSMREHQKYFAVVDNNGKLMPHFIAVNNTDTRDHALAVEGHQRVLRARLEDALFFFNEDKKHKLSDHTDNLSGVVFQSGLGTMQEKTGRMTELAIWLAAEVAPQTHGSATRAAALAKADLLTDMVNEFPSLQGMMGRAYALLDGEPEEVAQAIAEHYMPIRAGSSLPESDAGAIVGLADRIDSIAGCFGIGKKPTGSTDPYGLRRLSLGLLHIIEHKGYSLSIMNLAHKALELYGDKITAEPAQAREDTFDFIIDRYVNDRIARGWTASAVEAVTSSVNFDDVIDCDHRIKALMEVQSEETFTILAGSFKRVKNIIKGHLDNTVNENLLEEDAEKDLYRVFREVKDETAPLFESKEYQQAMKSILKMKEPVDSFFDDVMVMVDDEKLKNNRLSLLNAISGLFLKIGDFSRMS